MENQGVQPTTCYNARCPNEDVYRCYYVEKCHHTGCDAHVPPTKTALGTIRLCGACRLLRAIFIPEEYTNI